MRTVKIFWRAVGLGVAMAVAEAGQFANLGFDDVDVGVFGGYQATVAQGLPGWTMTRGVGDEQLPYAGPVELDAGAVCLHTSPHSLLSGYAHLNWLSIATHDWDLMTDFQYRLSQHGTVPEDAVELRLVTLYTGHFYINNVRVGFGYEETPATVSIDVTPYAGQEVTLEFRTETKGIYYMDILGFYPIPEPSTVALLGLGGLGLAWATRERRLQTSKFLFR